MTDTQESSQTGVCPGKLILFEGPDKSGKTTQSKRLEASLKRAGVPVVRIAFPDRTTPVGDLIDAYLRGEAHFDDEVIHLLFVVNRWERAQEISKLLKAGSHVILDRYVYSGWAYGVARGLDQSWAIVGGDHGLPKPDIVLYMRASMDIVKSRLPAELETTEDPAILEKVIELFDTFASNDTSAIWAPFDASKDADIIGAQVESALCAAMWHQDSPCTHGCFLQPWWASR